MEVSKSKLKSGDLLETMKFSYCADKDSFIKAFQKLGLPIKSEDDLLTLNSWSLRGLDKAGKIKNINGNTVDFDIKHFVNYSIKLNHTKVLNCKIKFID